MAAEASYILRGLNTVEYLGKVLPKFYDYSDDGIFQAGAYGPMVMDQLPYVVDALSKDKNSRQAVLSIWRPRPYKSKDIPCTLTMQFLIRHNMLYTVVNMRSSDVFKGLIYDTFCFAMISSVLADIIGYPLGITKIFAGSSHVYHDDLPKAESLLGEPGVIRQYEPYTPIALFDAIEFLEFVAQQENPLEHLLTARKLYAH